MFEKSSKKCSNKKKVENDKGPINVFLYYWTNLGPIPVEHIFELFSTPKMTILITSGRQVCSGTDR